MRHLCSRSNIRPSVDFELELAHKKLNALFPSVPIVVTAYINIRSGLVWSLGVEFSDLSG